MNLRTHKRRAYAGMARRFDFYTAHPYGRPLAMAWKRHCDGWWTPLAIVSGAYLLNRP